MKLLHLRYKYVLFILSHSTLNYSTESMYTHFFISTWTFWHEPSLSTFCAYFFRPEPSCAMCLIFLKLKPSCAYSAKGITLNFSLFLAKLCLWCAYSFRQKPSCAMCLIFSKKEAFMCLIGHVLIKKWV